MNEVVTLPVNLTFPVTKRIMDEHGVACLHSRSQPGTILARLVYNKNGRLCARWERVQMNTVAIRDWLGY